MTIVEQPNSPAVSSRPRLRPRRWPAAILAALAIIGAAASHSAQAQNADIDVRRASERTSFNDEEIRDGFFKIAFGAELQLDHHVERIRKYDEPIRVFVAGAAAPNRRAVIAAVIADIRARVAHLDMAITDERQAANFVVTLVPRRELARTIRAFYGRDRARQIQQSLDPQCLSGIGKDARYRIRRAEVILPADAEEFTFYDCVYEEMLQALGAINDDRSVPWTMFNDDVQMGFFDVYDQYLLNILYDPRVRPGMTKDEVGRLFPEIMLRVRAWVADANSLPARKPSGSANTD